MASYVNVGSIKVAEELYNFVNQEALPPTGLDVEQFWDDFEKLMLDFTPRNIELLEKRQEIQDKINKWHQENKEFNAGAYKTFLEEIGYLEPVVEDFKVELENIDDEIKTIPGPQLVVPINNARYAINAANSRWGSLYDAYYGTDVIDEEDGKENAGGYNPVRGAEVIKRGRDLLDESVPLATGSHKDATAYKIENSTVQVSLKNGETVGLKDADQFVGYLGEETDPSSLLFKNNGLHIDVLFDRNHPIGKDDDAGVKDIVLESAITSIMDCEDSVAAVDTADKVDVYRHWMGLIRGDLTVNFEKGGRTIERKFNDNRVYNGVNGGEVELNGRVLQLVRNVGHLLRNNAVLNPDGSDAYEGILDGVFTSLLAKHNLMGLGNHINSKEGSVYIVKPKMHGSEEVRFSNDLFARIEDMLDLERNTLKMGIMDEERRTSLNLKNCIYEAKERVIFINTGFLDRTGDEIHTSMEIGPINRTIDMAGTEWLTSYERANVEAGLSAGFQYQAQIGKGMWAKTDEMYDMVEAKIGHVKAGANTAWVPSPTAATLHALHYHQVDVREVQDRLIEEGIDNDYRDGILQIPVQNNPSWTKEEIMEEVENNAQKLLGYVVRWIEQGVGCSKVPDISDIGMMEDRATLRIGSQSLANWLRHGVVTEEEVMDVLKQMAEVVDKQNEGDALYRNMSPNFDDSIAFQAALDLVFKGTEQPNGYTEPILHERRLEFKEKFGFTY